MTKIISEQDIEALFRDSELGRPRFYEARTWVEKWFNSLPSAQGEAVAMLLHSTNLGFITQGVIEWIEIGKVKVGDKLYTAQQLPPDAEKRIAELEADKKRLIHELKETTKMFSRALRELESEGVPGRIWDVQCVESNASIIAEMEKTK